MTDVAAGKPDDEDNLRHRYESIEQRRQRILVYLGNGVSFGFLVAFGVLAIHAGRITLAWFTLANAAITLGNILLFKFTRNHTWASYGFSYGLLVLFTYLLASGGVDQTGPLWAYPMVAATISLMGARRGLFIIGAMFCIALVLFAVPLPWVEVTSYSLNFKIRFIATFLALTLFTALHEYARAKNQGELLRVSSRLDQLSHTDALTGLPNRRYMIDRLEVENSRHARHQRSYSILYGDVDNFKRINDEFGHQTGDAVLQAIARTIRSCLRQHDEVSRWGGEEFLILLPETDAPLSLEVAEKLRAAIAALQFRIDDATLPLTMSFGVHTVNGHGKIDAFIHHADQKLYCAKKNGKNRVVADLSASANA